MPLKYESLSTQLQKQIADDRAAHRDNPFRAKDEDVLRRNTARDTATLWRPAYVRDVEKIMHCPFYNRYADKTQVFSFYRNDDISRRALHVQLVSRIARNIGAVLGLNLDLIKAIALGHDIGHTPFGHAGERFLSDLYEEQTGRFFNHNVHSVRVLDHLFARNLSLQTLNGILCHNGEFELKEYRPKPMNDFVEFDRVVEGCYIDRQNVGAQVPSTLEGCVVRICDMIAYLGKDRQDAKRARLIGRDVPATAMAPADGSSGFGGSTHSSRTASGFGSNSDSSDSNSGGFGGSIHSSGIARTAGGFDSTSTVGGSGSPQEGPQFTKGSIGGENAEIINNLIVNILENSYGRDYLFLNKRSFDSLKTAKKENYQIIYRNPAINRVYDETIMPMFHQVYRRLLDDLKEDRRDSVVFRHHIDFINENRKYYGDLPPYREEEPNQIIVDYIASMTDDYFVDLYHYLFPERTYEIQYVSYFDDMR